MWVKLYCARDWVGRENRKYAVMENNVRADSISSWRLIDYGAEGKVIEYYIGNTGYQMVDKYEDIAPNAFNCTLEILQGLK